VAGGDTGDELTLRLIDPSGNIYASATPEFDQPLGHSVWVYNWFLSDQIGAWRAEFVTNGVVARIHPFQVQ
jgi:hypothetical protein